MRPVLLDFERGKVAKWLGGSPRPIPRVLAVLALTASLGMTLVVAIRYWQLHQLAAAHAEVEAATMKRNQKQSIVSAPAPSAAQKRAQARMVEQLNTPWPAILNTLEERLPKQVAVLSIEPDGAVGRVRMELEARQLPLLLDFVRDLEGAAPFGRVSIGRHEHQERDPGAPYRMVLDAKLTPSAQDGGKDAVR